MAELNSFAIYWRTLRHLQPSQIAHRVWLRGRLHLERRSQLFISLSDPGPRPKEDSWPIEFTPIDARARGLWPERLDRMTLSFQVLGRTVSLQNQETQVTALSRLVSFHLHYWDWAWALMDLPVHERREGFADFFEAWDRGWNVFLYGDAWSPYVVSLRSWSWCCQFDSLIRGSRAEQSVRQLLWKQLKFIRTHLERDVGGNHLLKNLKAWLALGIFFGSDRDITRAIAHIEKQISIQILADGGHFERAPAYHVQVLADLLDIRDLLSVAYPREGISRLNAHIEAMQSFLERVLDPNGEVILLNDGFPVHQDLVRNVQSSTRHQGSALLGASGIARLERNPWTVFVDVGDPCPDTLPAHAHADTLTCLIFFNDEPVIGEAYTSTYSNDSQRLYERSTAGHSTLELSGLNSTEVWGSFRAGRRARVHDLTFDDEKGRAVSIAAWHDGYRHLASQPIHFRKVVVLPSEILIVDRVTSHSPVDFVLRWHIAQDLMPTVDPRRWTNGTNVQLELDPRYSLGIEPSARAIGYQTIEASRVVSIRGVVDGVAEIRTRLTQRLEAT